MKLEAVEVYHLTTKYGKKTKIIFDGGRELWVDQNLAYEAGQVLDVVEVGGKLRLAENANPDLPQKNDKNLVQEYQSLYQEMRSNPLFQGVSDYRLLLLAVELLRISRGK